MVQDHLIHMSHERPAMTESFMSQRTAELLLLLYDDGVDQEELKALVGSAFEDGVNCAINQIDEAENRSDT